MFPWRIAMLLRAVLAATSLALVAPAAAQAACGDWLSGEMSGSAHVRQSAAVPPGAGESGPQLPLPCRGPECRNAPAEAPLPVPAPSLASDVERWCLTSAVQCDVRTSALRRTPHERTAPATGEPQDILRPPRLTAT